LSGAFDPDTAMALIERHFGEIPPGPGVVPFAAGPPALPPGGAREEMADAVELSRIYLSWAIPAYGSDDWYAADLLSTVLSGGRSSPLYRDLVYERQLAQDVSAFALPTELAGTFSVVATARPEVDPARLEEAVRGHLAVAAAAAPPDGDLERARNRVLTLHCEALQQLDQRADQLSQLTTYFGNPHLLAAELERYRELAGADLRRCADRWLTPERSVALTVVPRRDVA
jgi:zinc protease